MTRIRMTIVALACTVVMAPPALAHAQMSAGQTVVRIGEDYSLGAHDTNREVFVVMGNAAIEGRIDGDLRVFFGQARLAGTAVIGGSLVVIGGGVTVEPGAQLERDLVIVGGGFDGPGSFTPGGESIVVGARTLGRRLESIVPWITRGLLWGRPIVPTLPWIWAVVGVLFLVYLALNVILHQPVRACAEALVGTPLTTLMVGLLVLLLTGPICVLLAVSVIGIAVIPFVLCLLLIAGIVGRIGVVRWIGVSVLPQARQDTPLQSLVPFVVGFAALCVAYMIPLLGLVAWTIVGVFGLGASTLAFIAAYRRENPKPARSVPAAADHPNGGGVGMNGEFPAAAPAAPEVPIPTTSPLASGGDLASFPRASLRDRVAAAALDVILILIVSQLVDIFRHDRSATFFLLLLVYHIGLTAWKGTTIGGIICQLRVVRVDGTPLRPVDSVVRGLSGVFSLAVFGLGFLWILKDPERQAWHDRIAGTYVVRVPRNWPL